MAIMRKILFLWLLLWPLWAAGSPGLLHADELAQEYQLKAAFLVNFAKFITWPAQAFPPGQQEFVLCVAGDNPFGAALSGIENKTIGGRPIRTVQVDSLKKVPTCHLLFVSRSEEANLRQLTNEAGRQAIVTVSDIADLADAASSTHCQSSATASPASSPCNARSGGAPSCCSGTSRR